MPEIQLIDKKTNKSFNLNYENYGNPSNKPIIMIHGWLCNSKFWEDFQVLGDQGYYVLIPNLRGHGATDYTPDMTAISMGDDIYELMEHLKISKAIVIGQSMGGLVTQAFYKKHPEKVIALGLWNTGGRIGLGYGIKSTFYVFRLAAFVIGLILTYPIGPCFRLLLGQGWKLAWKKGGKDPGYQKYVGDVKKMKRKAVLKAVFALAGFDVREDLENIKVPTMLLHGIADRYITPIQLVKLMQAKIPNTELFTVQEGSHFPANEQPEEVLGYLKQFLAKIK
jgi:3-oxoadipate enol-lactonase